MKVAQTQSFRPINRRPDVCLSRQIRSCLLPVFVWLGSKIVLQFKTATRWKAVFSERESSTQTLDLELSDRVGEGGERNYEMMLYLRLCSHHSHLVSPQCPFVF